MKRVTKKSVRIALGLCLTGLLILFVSFIAVGFDMKKLSTVTYETNWYDNISEEFDCIVIETKTADITVGSMIPSTCSVECYEETWMTHTVTVKEGTLWITAEDTAKWYDHIGVSGDKARVKVYLPEMNYKNLEIKSNTGDVTIGFGLQFDKVTVETDTGDVKVTANVLEELKIKTTTGVVSIDNAMRKLCFPEETDKEGALFVSAETDTGEITLEEIVCRDFAVKSDTGEIRIKDTVAGFNGTVISQTGDVTIENSDAVESLYIKTDTGDVTGTLLSGKEFQTETDTGNIDVPATNGYPCVIITDTGDINIEVIGK